MQNKKMSDAAIRGKHCGPRKSAPRHRLARRRDLYIGLLGVVALCWATDGVGEDLSDVAVRTSAGLWLLNTVGVERAAVIVVCVVVAYGVWEWACGRPHLVSLLRGGLLAHVPVRATRRACAAAGMVLILVMGTGPGPALGVPGPVTGSRVVAVHQ